MELAEEQAAEYEQAAHFVQSKRNSAKTQYKYRKKPNQQHQQAHHQNKHQQCGLCGGRYPHSRECPAKGKRCAACGKLNHFARVCRSSQRDQSASDLNHQKGKEKSKRAFTVNENPDPESSGEDHDEHTDEDGYVFTMSESYRKSPNFDIILCGSKLRALADTGASVNTISESDYHKLKEKPNLKQSKECVYSYASIQPLNVAGQFTAVVHRANHDIKVTADFLVVPGESRTLLSSDTSQALNLIKVVAHTSSVTGEQSKSNEGVKSCKGEPVRITIDESVPPVPQPHRRVPFHMRN